MKGFIGPRRRGRHRLRVIQFACLLGFFWAGAFPVIVTRTVRPVFDRCLKAAEHPSPNSGSFDSALCIIPPDDAWDVIQRARHLARDATFYTWPPAIRLFHPFVPKQNLTDIATEIAHRVQTYNLTSFEITLDQLLILPHFEILEEMEDRLASLPTQMSHKRSVSGNHPGSDKHRGSLDHDLDDVQQLIRKEELKGMKKLQQRLSKAKQQSEINKIHAQQQLNTQQHTLSPREVMKQQKEDFQKFNGPCVVCLEPNDESKARLLALREKLRQDLFPDYDGFSVSSSVSSSKVNSLPRHVLKKHDMYPFTEVGNHTSPASFRPTLVLGAFSSVNKAVHFAKKLQRSWEPLTFHVSDLHLVSRTMSPVPSSTTDLQPTFSAGFGGTHSSSSFKQSYSYESIINKDDDIFMARGEYGCDAMIFLMGEEWQLDAEVNAAHSDHLLDSSHPLNRYNSQDLYRNHSEFDYELGDDELLMDYTNNEDIQDNWENREYNRYYDQEYVQEWLEEDDELDDGATIIVGRTQFFTGEMRKYIGMPAYSPMDGKDRVLGDGINALDRRKTAVNRKMERWAAADYGDEK